MAGAIVTKTLVFKPKTAKTATPVPIVVFALQDTQTPAALIALAAKAKEPRLAKDELVQEFFGVAAKEVSIFDLKKDLAGKISLLVDETLLNADDAVELEYPSGSTAKGLVKDIKKFLEESTIEIVAVDFAAAPAPAPASAKEAKDNSKKEAAKREKEASKIEDAKLIGITVDKTKDFSSWYSQVCVKGEMLDYYDVSGCYILRPNSYHVWEQIQDWFNLRIKRLGVKNAYFPMFVSSRVLEKEKDHIEGFAPEVAWVTKAGSSE